LLSDEDAVDLERLLRVIADRQRLKILNLLLGADEAICVCELVPILGLAQPTVSHHLGKLTQVGLLERERRGAYAHYRIADGALDRAAGVLRGIAPAAA
jgi:ArsR family transcriptional regulator